MRKNRDLWLNDLISPRIEGGTNEKNLSWDNGGFTSHGVTQATYSTWVRRPVSIDEMKELKPETARDVAVGMFWNVAKCDGLPGGLDLYLADYSFHSGPPRAVKALQKILGVEADGVVGEKTLAAARSEPDTRRLIALLDEERLAFLKRHEDWEKAKNGWTNRLASMRAAAMKLVEPNYVEAKAPQAAAKAGALVTILALVAQMAPQLMAEGQRANEAASAGDWSAVALILAGLIGAGYGFFNNQRAWRAAKLSGVG